MVAAAFGGRHHVVIHYVVTDCFCRVWPSHDFRLLASVVFRRWPGQCLFRLLVHIVFAHLFCDFP